MGIWTADMVENLYIEIGGGYMTEEWLDRIRSYKDDIRRHDETIECLRSRAERVTNTLTGMPPGSPKFDELSAIAAQIVDLETAAAKRFIEYTERCREAEEWLDKLPEQQRNVMRMYYVDGAKTWQKVADKVPYSYRHTKRIKESAFRKLETRPPMSPNNDVK